MSVRLSSLRFKESTCVLLVLLFWIVIHGAGCSTASADKGGRGRAEAPAPEKGFYATCTTETSGGHKGPWTGPLRTTKEDAEKDGEEHESQNSGHTATIVEY